VKEESERAICQGGGTVVKRIKKLARKNEGISLVEVVVSMLVLAIIAVPLLQSFVVSAQINSKTRTKQYATTLAQSVMEGLKSYDIADVALQVNGVASPAGIKFIPESALSGGTTYETDASFQNILNDTNVSAEDNDSDGRYQFRENSDKKYYYFIKGVKEGTKVFDVRITYDGGQFLGNATVKQNKYQEPKLDNLVMKETALINPQGANIEFEKTGDVFDFNEINGIYQYKNDLSYDNEAVEYFFMLHKNYENQQYQVLRAQKIAAKEVIPPQNPFSDKKDIQNQITRKTEVSIKDHGSGYVVSCRLVYVYHQDDSTPKIQASNGEIEREYSGFYSAEFEFLSNIYLFHFPLAITGWRGTNPDEIYIRNFTINQIPLSIFVAEQPDKSGFLSHNSILVKAINEKTSLDSSNVIFYNINPVNPISDTTLLGGSQVNALVERGESRKRIYQVKVEIYPSGSNTKLFELSSTITQ
jgi:type II secretory pathway pseudopilin PulG